MKNYCFNVFSSPGLGLKLQKCVFKDWWCHNPSFAIAWRQNFSILNEYIVLEESQKNIDYKHFHERKLWVSDDIIIMSQAPRPKVWLGTGSFLLSDTWGTIFSSQTFLRKEWQKIWNSDLSGRCSLFKGFPLTWKIFPIWIELKN